MITRNVLSAASLAILTGAFVIPSATAATIVNWGGDYVSGTAEFSNAVYGVEDTSPSTYGGYSEGSFLQLSPGGGYSGGTFYGSIIELAGYSEGGALSLIKHDSAGDLIQLKSKDGGETPAAFLVLWNQSDFLNGGNTGPVSFDSSSEIRLNIHTFAGQNGADTGRLVIQSSGNYYVSQQVVTGSGDATIGGLTGPAFNWFDYDPTSSPNVDNGSLSVAGSLVEDGVIDGITSVGFYFESGLAGNAVRIRNFEVNAAIAAIPEPSTYAMLAGGLCLVGAAIRRRRR